MMRLMVCEMLLLFGHVLADTAPDLTQADAHASAESKTLITMEGDTAILDWAKCCDCEETLVKPKGKPCEVTISTAHKLRLKYTNSKWKHNIIEVPSKDDFDTCQIPSDKMAIGQVADMPGVKTMDETMTYTKAGTFYYVCSVMCLSSTGGPNDQYCHCGGFQHKLIVTVTAADGPAPEPEPEPEPAPAPAPITSDLKDIVDTAVDAGTFTLLAEALTKADLVTILKGSGPFTVFAPTDDAFTVALKSLGITKEELFARPKKDLADILTYHVVKGAIKSKDLTNDMKATTVQGAKIGIAIDGTTVKVNTATVTAADVMCSNGVIHIIDEVLLPPKDAAPQPEPEPEPEPEPSPSPSPSEAGMTSAAKYSQYSAFLVFGAILSSFFYA